MNGHDRKTNLTSCIVVLVAEECGFSPTRVNKADVKFPLNINDADIYPTIEHAPKERAEFTELTWQLIRVRSPSPNIDPKTNQQIANPPSSNYVRNSKNSILMATERPWETLRAADKMSSRNVFSCGSASKFSRQSTSNTALRAFLFSGWPSNSAIA